jgi:hypothetical protein
MCNDTTLVYSTNLEIALSWQLLLVCYLLTYQQVHHYYYHHQHQSSRQNYYYQLQQRRQQQCCGVLLPCLYGAIESCVDDVRIAKDTFNAITACLIFDLLCTCADDCACTEDTTAVDTTILDKVYNCTSLPDDDALGFLLVAPLLLRGITALPLLSLLRLPVFKMYHNRALVTCSYS